MATYQQTNTTPVLAADRYAYPPATRVEDIALSGGAVRNITTKLTFSTLAVSPTSGTLLVYVTGETATYPTGLAVRRYSSTTVLPSKSVGGPSEGVTLNIPYSERTDEGLDVTSIVLNLEAYIPTAALLPTTQWPTDGTITMVVTYNGSVIDPATPGTDNVIALGGATLPIYRAVLTDATSDVPSTANTRIGSEFGLQYTIFAPSVARQSITTTRAYSLDMSVTALGNAVLSTTATPSVDGTISGTAPAYTWTGTSNAFGVISIGARVEVGVPLTTITPTDLLDAFAATLTIVPTAAIFSGLTLAALGNMTSTTNGPTLEFLLPDGSTPSYRINGAEDNLVSVRVRTQTYTDLRDFTALSPAPLFTVTFTAPTPLPDGFAWVGSGTETLVVDGPATLATDEFVTISAPFTLSAAVRDVLIAVELTGSLVNLSLSDGIDLTGTPTEPLARDLASISDIVTILADQVLQGTARPMAAYNAEQVARTGGLTREELCEWASRVYAPGAQSIKPAYTGIAELIQCSSSSGSATGFFMW